ncbi:MAG: hypothetical protein HOP33_06955 [Verrucomicrobia bacterium]|nr:hypothetical protein [Verrucomicrobiota bacterium]
MKPVFFLADKFWRVTGAVVIAAMFCGGCVHHNAQCAKPRVQTADSVSSVSTNKTVRTAKRFNYTPRPYPVDERGFSPVDKTLAAAYAREDMVADDDEGALNPYVMKVILGFPLDGSYPYHCGWEPREYDIYNGVTQDQWYKGMVVAKAYPDGSRCSYCCGFTFEVFIRAMKLRNIQKGLDPEDFNGMTFGDLFNALQFWYIEGKGDCERRAIESYGLGYAVADFEKARPGDFLSYDTTAPGGHSCILVSWIRDGQNKIVGLKYFSSNLSGSKGVGYGQGRFSDANGGRGIIRKSVRLARVGAIKDYKPFNRVEIPQRNAYAPTQPDRILYVPAPVGK